MSLLMRISRLIDAVNDAIGRWAKWLILLAVLVCAGNAIIRYTFSVSSNAWLELQWYMFAGVFLLGAPYTLRKDEHVRIDVIAGRFSERTQVWIDIVGILLFLLPISLIILWLSIPYFWLSYAGQEMSGNAGGLIRWPAKFLIVAGFFLLNLQGLSELIKRFAYLRGELPFEAFRKHGHSPAENAAALTDGGRSGPPATP
ncbi:TRAP transporter small permease subunit [Cupriavidus gilardii]|uniref:TRAP transporter small permease protein n=1 Tax=Cupriavidus gilardii TaxID=82541 RepID=A0A6N1BD86_9BURK|nr:TRAP transporter small permease subunit [Cupriavidus gilardii]QQE07334.1 TRAP transporter small permease subunit [Cupriavidus sp. ISTL7]KAB0598874.1 TRAP transporter small permease subunit [Cupriavidus gilardii]MCT9015975.1 TRAP transporter small permease subunit [Cupriavidus gilardii]MCT9055745.1 TRAP transporter small permease subunit [Cupriavidus gilardii]MCT9071016.1 TRAP transporter small permease subunit [Cupriavidus gilardii]